MTLVELNKIKGLANIVSMMSKKNRQLVLQRMGDSIGESCIYLHEPTKQCFLGDIKGNFHSVVTYKAWEKLVVYGVYLPCCVAIPADRVELTELNWNLTENHFMKYRDFKEHELLYKSNGKVFIWID
jgi:hypothetical protein